MPQWEGPQVLDSQPDLLDAGLVKPLIQGATMMTHQDNQDAAKFLIYVARQLSKGPGLYPPGFNPVSAARSHCRSYQNHLAEPAENEAHDFVACDFQRFEPLL